MLSDNKKKLFEIEFSPKGFRKNSHYQTISPALFYNPSDLDSTEKVIVKLNKDNALSCDYNKYYLTSKSDACVILVHGLGSDSKANYIVSTAKKILNNKVDTFRINLRTANDTFKLSNNLYHAGISEDIDKVVNYVINDFSL